MNEIIHTIRKRCRQLRKNPTPSEKKLWKYLRKRQLNGLKFLRQYPIKFAINNKTHFFIADFYCHQLKLVIELDGSIHNNQKDYDKMRTCMLNEMGIKVLRFANREVLEDIDNVLSKIKGFV